MSNNKINIKNQSLIQIVESWGLTDNPINSTEEILEWIHLKNNENNVSIKKIPFNNEDFWYYDKNYGGLINRNSSFFKIKGIVKKSEMITQEQPIIIQNEIGYLGIIAKSINGIMYFLMQAKIEPGNINKVQLSPTIQATKSNFMQAHGGKTPAYLEYFSNKKNHEIVVDQIQSEQSSRFLGKRNRNIILVVNDEVDVLDSHRWMTLGQIKQLMSYDNLVNMDTRTVISCIPFSLRDFTYKELIHIKSLIKKEALFNSIFLRDSGYEINKIYQYMNEIKMLDKSEISVVDLYSLKNWCFIGNEFQGDGDFKIVYCDIEIEGREIQHWKQPLLEATGRSIYGLIYCIDDGVMKFLIQTISEIGCFDKIEIGPSIQLGPHDISTKNEIETMFLKKYERKENIDFSGLFSEEGGRFYHEENENIVMKIEKNEIGKLPDGYFWVDYQILNILIQFNNCLNIQLRNLLSILEL